MQCPTELMVADQHLFPALTRLLRVEWICSFSAWINTYVTMFQLLGSRFKLYIPFHIYCMWDTNVSECGDSFTRAFIQAFCNFGNKYKRMCLNSTSN